MITINGKQNLLLNKQSGELEDIKMILEQYFWLVKNIKTGILILKLWIILV